MTRTRTHKETKYATPTAVLLRKLEYCTNPVTKSVLRDIIGNRIDNN